MLRKQLSVVIPQDKEDVYTLLCNKCQDRSVSDFLVTLIDSYINSPAVSTAVDDYVYGDEADSGESYTQSLAEAQAMVMAQGMAIQQAKMGIQNSMEDIQDMMDDGVSTSVPEPEEPVETPKEETSDNKGGNYVTKEEVIDILDAKINQLLSLGLGGTNKPASNDTVESSPIENDEIEVSVEEEKPEVKIDSEEEEDATSSVLDLLGSLS